MELSSDEFMKLLKERKPSERVQRLHDPKPP